MNSPTTCISLITLTVLIALTVAAPASATVVEVQLQGYLTADNVKWLVDGGIEQFNEGDPVDLSFTSLLSDVDINTGETWGEYPNAIQDFQLVVGGMVASGSGGLTTVGNDNGSYDGFYTDSWEFDSVSGLAPGLSLHSTGAIILDDTATIFDSDSLVDSWDWITTNSEPFTHLVVSFLIPGFVVSVAPEITQQTISVIPEPSSGVLLAGMCFVALRHSRRQPTT